MAKKSASVIASDGTEYPCAIFISSNTSYYGTKWVDVYAGGLAERENSQNTYCHGSDEVAGIATGKGNLAYRLYRRNPKDDLYGGRSLSFSYVNPGYYDVHCADLHTVEAMAKGLKTLNARLAKQREKYGYTDSFSESVLRIANAFGAESIAVEWGLFTEATGIEIPDYERNRGHKVLSLADARGYLDMIAKVDVVERCRCCKAAIPNVRSQDNGECHDCKEELRNANDKATV